MQCHPLAHELERTTRQLAHEHRAGFDRDHRVMLSVLSMEMGRFEVHRDHHAVEHADPEHSTIMIGAWDGCARRLRPSSNTTSNPAKTGIEGRRSNTDTVWRLIGELHAER